MVAALLSTLVATILMVAVNRIATEYVSDEVTAAGDRVAGELIRGYRPNPLSAGPIEFIQIVDPSRRVVAATYRLQSKPPIADFTPAAGKTIASRVVCGGTFPDDECYIVVGQRAYVMGQDWMVYAAAPQVPPLVHPTLAALVIGGTVFLTAAITYGAYRLLSRALNPVNAIRAELDEINASCPDRRVPVPPARDEIQELAESVNHTLDRLQAAMEQQRQFASDASHDLRSPITAMRAEVEDALLAPEETNISVMGDSLLESLDRLQAIVSDLLIVARLDAGTPGERERVDLSALINSELNRRHSRLTIKRDLQPGVVVMGDRLRLARLFTNLMDNAERHAEQSISVTVRSEPPNRRFRTGVIVLEVQDDGPGIEPDKREAVFQRFTRLDAARSKDAGGTGLGLPIARQIAQATGGTLTIEPSDKGARFVLCLPLALPSEEDED
ncbi:sensor histidine kinase [Sphaerisporangium fuscum]|uniref:sensor histidine kinase n=1 Tax=Sphaerisporangium fuscum TaxID=2835868 RepID=UPI0027E2A91F|nr:HAMP domain-containing sensor histidine kinase [Sphaerisporangium fuscum]